MIITTNRLEYERYHDAWATRKVLAIDGRMWEVCSVNCHNSYENSVVKVLLKEVK